MLESRASMDANESDLALIGQYIPEGWPRPTAEDVYTASALVCNDMVDSYSTRFTLNALGQIARLIPGCNVMRNHNEYGSEDLPVARAFAADVVSMDGANHVRARFYWPRMTDCGMEMARNIALAVWREMSLSWWMRSFTNSIDGKPFDESPYYPGQELPDGQTVIGIMDEIMEVNEFSFVARGGQKDTAILPARAEDVVSIEGLVAAARSRASVGRGLKRYFPAA